jgi:hypothetical protein
MKAKINGLKLLWMAAFTLNTLAICGQGLNFQLRVNARE